MSPLGDLRVGGESVSPLGDFVIHVEAGAVIVFCAPVGGEEIEAAAGVLPFYGKMGAGPLAIWRDVGVHVFGWQVFTFLGFLALLGLTAEVPQDLALRRWCGLLGVVYGALHFTLQRKGWTYHLYPLVSFLLVVASPAFGEDRSGGSLREDLRALGRLLLPSQRAFLSTRQVARLLLAMVAGLLAVGGGMNLAGREIEPAVR